MRELPQLSLPEWIVLTLVEETPRHGFAVAALTGSDGDVGRAWLVPRPIVYRAVGRLTEIDLIAVSSTEHGGRGPQRSVLAATSAGASAVVAWLAEPVAHVRDVRSELLVKLALISRRDWDPTKLVAAQRTRFQPIEESLARQQAAEEGISAVLASYRTESVRSALRFLDEVDNQTARALE